MSGNTFDLVFSGQLVKGVALAQALKNVQVLFKIDEVRAKALFTGKDVTLKKGVDFDTASKYRVAMKKAGIVVNLVEQAGSASPANASSPTSPTKQQANSVTQPHAAQELGGNAQDIATELGAQPSKPAVPRSPIEAPDFGVADQQGYLVAEGEIPKPDAVVVDVSNIDLRPQDGFLVDENEIARVSEADVNVPNLDVAPAGSDVLKENERKVVPPVQVDIGDLSMAEAGTRLAPEKELAPPAPNTDHISLAD